MSDIELTDDTDFSDVSDTSDSDLEDLLEERIRPKNQIFFEVIVPQFNRKEFTEHFRMDREKATEISERFGTSNFYKDQTGPYGKISPFKYICIFLWYAGHQTASYRDVADRFDICISALYKVIKRVKYFPSNLAPEVITWPNAQEKLEIQQFFLEKNGFPGIVGIIDGTHIKIDRPEEDPDSYINRKGYYSIQAQLVCDHKLQIRDIYIGYPGSVHDARVFRTSPLAETLEDKCQNGHLLGDSAYPLSKNLLTPFPDRGLLTPGQVSYNMKHSSNRIRIEHCNGVLKQKWRQLYHLKLRKIRGIVHFIRACFVLHNLALHDNDNIEVVENEEIDAERNIPENPNNFVDDINGAQKRNNIVEILTAH